MASSLAAPIAIAIRALVSCASVKTAEGGIVPTVGRITTRGIEQAYLLPQHCGPRDLSSVPMSDSEPEAPDLCSSSSEGCLPLGTGPSSSKSDSDSSGVEPASASTDASRLSWWPSGFPPSGCRWPAPAPGEGPDAATPEPREGQGLDWLRGACPTAILAGLATPASVGDRSRRPPGIDSSGLMAARVGRVAGAALGGNGHGSGADPVPEPAQGGVSGSGVGQETGGVPPPSKQPRGRKQAQRPQRSRRHRDKR